MKERVLLSGGAGFIGHHLTRRFMNRGWEVVVLDRIDVAGSMHRLPHDLSAFVRHDLVAPLNKYVDEQIGHVDYVAHLAAGSHVDRSVRHPLEFVQDNVVGTANLFEWCRTRPAIKKILYFSTDEVYGPAPEGVEFKEFDTFDANNPYAATKAAAECLCPAWAYTFGLPIVISHCTNVYGSGQDEEKYIPLARRRIEAGEVLQIHASQDLKTPSSRYYVHALDVCKAVTTILDKGGVIAGPGTGRYSLCGDREYSNLEVAETIAELVDKPLHHEMVNFVKNRPRHDMRYAVRDDKLRALGWKPQVELRHGLKEALGLI